MTDDGFRYENTLTLEELRCEVRRAWDEKHALLDALRKLPEMPPGWVLNMLGAAAKYPEDWEIGKRLQMQRGGPDIPFKTECELGAGLWTRLRAALLAGKDTPKPEQSQGIP